jgi:hypothetical protein
MERSHLETLLSARLAKLLVSAQSHPSQLCFFSIVESQQLESSLNRKSFAVVSFTRQEALGEFRP